MAMCTVRDAMVSRPGPPRHHSAAPEARGTAIERSGQWWVLVGGVHFREPLVVGPESVPPLGPAVTPTREFSERRQGPSCPPPEGGMARGRE